MCPLPVLRAMFLMLWTGTCQSSSPALSNSEWCSWRVGRGGEEGGREGGREGMEGRGKERVEGENGEGRGERREGGKGGERKKGGKGGERNKGGEGRGNEGSIGINMDVVILRL